MGVPLATSVALYAVGVRSSAKALSATAARAITMARRVVQPEAWARVIRTANTPRARRLSGRTAGVAVFVAAVAVGGPAIQAHTEMENSAHDWRQRAKASLAMSAVAPSGPPELRASVTPRADATPRVRASQDVARVRDVAAARHAAYADANREAWSPFQQYAPALFEDAVRQRREHDCLARAIYYEARAEADRGQYAVAEVVLNRVSHPLYPNNVCDVVYEGANRTTGCQFTFTCDGSERRGPRGRAWTRAQSVAAFALMGEAPAVTGEATHYHADYIRPYWAPSLQRTETIGAHVFYRMPRG